MKKKSKTITNYIYSSFYQLFLIIVPLVTAPYLARTLLPTAVGINSYVSSVVNIFTLLGLIGLGSYSLREIAYVRDNKEKLSKTFSELFLLRMVCFLITAVIYFIYAYFSEYRLYFFIQFIAVASGFLDIAWLYQGFEEFKMTVTRNFIVKILNVLSIFLFIKGPDDLCLFMVISSIFSLVVNLVLYFGIRKRIGKFTFRGLRIKKHLIPTLKLFLPQVASMVYLQCDKMMIKFLAIDVSFVGFYDQAERIIKMPLALITALSTVMLPRLANEFKNSNYKAVSEYIFSAFNFSLLLAIPLMFGLAAISSTMIPWFLGKGYEDVIPVMMILSPIVLFISMSSVSGNQYLTAVNKTRVLTISCVCGAIINLIINAILIPYFNAFGAAIGTLVAEIVVFAIQIYNIKEIIKFKELVRMGKNYFIGGVIMFSACYLIGLYLGASIVSSLIQVVIGGVIYFGVLFILKDAFFNSFLVRFLNMIKAKFNLS